MKKKLSLIILPLVFISIFAIKSDDFDLIKNIEIYQNVLRELRTDYVDEVDINKLVTTSIKSMLKTLDPYTVYYPEEEIEDARIFSEATYTGIGIIVSRVGKSIYIQEVLQNSPADKAGVKQGYQIISVNGKNISGLSMNKIHLLITGEPGSKVKMEFKIPGTDITKNLNIERQNIKLQAVSYYGITDENIGYIRLEQFSNQAYEQFKNAFIELKKQKINGLIIDLRNNPGGLLNEAVDILSLFIPKGTLVVSTKGKNPQNNSEFKTNKRPVDTKIPITVLVNGRSASAAEIVSGTLQDLDRAVIIGEQTYGKGLVQKTARTGYNTLMKLTISKYYIPSGRCIQAYNYQTHKSTKNTADSLLNKFYTKNGRPVYEGKGIIPDLKVKKSSDSSFVDSLVKNKIFIRFSAYYGYIKKDNIPPADNINFSDWKIFENFLSQTYTYNSKTLAEIEGLIQNKENLISENDLETLKKIKDDIKAAQSYSKLIEKNKSQIKSHIETALISYKYYRGGLYHYLLLTDKQSKTAKLILKDENEYEKILKGN